MASSFAYAFTLILLTAAPSTLAHESNIWRVSIDHGPAPSPEDGPPFSANASRDHSLLPFQIIGIVGSYFGAVLILGTLLLTVGRKLRLRAQKLASRPVEMVKPTAKKFDESPISPLSNRSWYAAMTLRNKKSLASSSMQSGDARSPDADSVVSFDNSVLEADRTRRQEEMERLYAAVMAQDERRSQASTSQQDMHGHPYPPPQYSRSNPPHLVTESPIMRQQYSASPRSPGRPPYPFGSPAPPLPDSPILRGEYNGTPVSQFPSSSTQELNPTNATAFDQPSTSTSGKKLKKQLRNIQISAPIRSDNADDARTPLTPRSYPNPGVAPEPFLTSPRSHRFAGLQHDPEEQLDEIRDLPRAHPNRPIPPAINTSIPNQPPLPPPPVLTTTTQPKPSTSSAAASMTNPLPFRQLAAQQREHYHAQMLANRQQQSPSSATSPSFPFSSTGGWAHSQRSSQQQYLHPMSAGPTKTTFLEARRDRFAGPRTGLATPYSPYMPFTPLTPVTPRIASRAERRAREKEDRKVRGVVTEEDEVKTEGELFGSGY